MIWICVLLAALGFGGFCLWLAEWHPGDRIRPPRERELDLTRWGRR